MLPVTLSLVGFASPFEFLPAFLHPVFASSPASNARYLQAIDHAGHIAGFEHAEITGRYFVNSNPEDRSVGGDAVFAFGIGHRDEILFGARGELAPRLAEIRKNYESFPALYLSIVEFCGLDELKSANRHAYANLRKRAGSAAARSWRDSQIVLPLVRAALAHSQDQAGESDVRVRRISVHSMRGSRLRVLAQGYDPGTTMQVLDSKKTKTALIGTGLMDDVTVALIDTTPTQRPTLSQKPAPKFSRRGLSRNEVQSSLELALEELVGRGLSPKLRRWLNDFAHTDFRHKTDELASVAYEWCERQPTPRAALAYARLLTLDAVPITLFRAGSDWLAPRQSEADVGPLYPPAIDLLRAREALYLTPSHRIARGAIISTKNPRRRAAKALTAGDLRESEIPLWALDWISKHPKSRLVPEILQALIELPFDYPHVYSATRAWLKRSGRKTEAARVLLALFRSKSQAAVLEDLSDRVMRWVEVNPQHADAPRLLLHLLSVNDKEETSKIESLAAWWARNSRSQSDVIPILTALIRRNPSKREAISLALRWSGPGTEVPTAAKLLAVLLSQVYPLSDVRRHAERWLVRNSQDPAALVVFDAYFGRGVSVTRKPHLLQRALALIDAYPEGAGAGSLLGELINFFPENDRVLDGAVSWLSNVKFSREARPTIAALLRYKGRKRRAKIKAAVRRWLSTHPRDAALERAYRAF